MYPLTDAQKQILQNNRQHASITMDDLTITDADILEGGMVINRSTQSGTSIEIGSVVAAELALQLQNFDGRFDADDFEGQTLDVAISATNGTNTVNLPMGSFIVDSVQKSNRKIQVLALDKMAAFDKDSAQWTGTKTLANLVIWCASQCGVACQLTPSDFSEYPNYNVAVSVPDGQHTYRELLSWACECMGVCAYADWAGRLQVGWYSNTGLNISSSNSKEGSTERAENTIVITGVKIDDTQYGNAGYILQISDNDFASEKSSVVGPALRTWLNGFSYTPMSTTVRTMPWVWPLDGDSQTTIVTNATHKLNGYSSLSAKGESMTKTGMAKANPLTRRESALVKALQAASRAETDYKIDALLLMNKLAAYSMGLYDHVEELEDGSKIFTYTDAPELSGSTKVYRFNANGFFVSNDGGQTWSSGLDADGNLIVHILTADIVVTGTLRDISGNNWWNLDTGEIHFSSIENHLSDLDDNSLSNQNSISELYQSLDNTTEELTSVKGSVTSLSSDLSDFKEETSTTISQTADRIEFDFDQRITQMNESVGENSADIADIHRYIRFVNGNIELGEEGSPIKQVIQNDRDSFYYNGVEVAYISDNKLYITEAEILSGIVIGKHKWLARGDRMTLVYTG